MYWETCGKQFDKDECGRLYDEGRAATARRAF
jgi:hypothetical protein